MEQKTRKKSRRALVVSKSGDKSIVVKLEYIVKHPKYGKYLRRSTKLGVHDEKNAAGVGDIVTVTECRPMSKSKSWRLVDVVQKGIAQ